MPTATIYEIESNGKVNRKQVVQKKKEGPSSLDCAEQQVLTCLTEKGKTLGRYLMVVDAWPCATCIGKLKEFTTSNTITIFVRTLNGKLTTGEYATHHLEDITADSNLKMNPPIVQKWSPKKDLEKQARGAQYMATSSSSHTASSSSSTIASSSSSPIATATSSHSSKASSSSPPPVNPKYSLLQAVIEADGKEAGAIIIYQKGTAMYVPYRDLTELTSHASINAMHVINVAEYFAYIE